MDTNQKIKNWFKTNWISFVLILTVVGVAALAYRQFALADNYEDLLNAKYTEQAESFKKQINEIQTINDQRFKAQEQLLKEYDEKYRLINEKYQTKLNQISLNQKKNQTKIVEDAKENPMTLTNKVKDVWGIPCNSCTEEVQ